MQNAYCLTVLQTQFQIFFIIIITFNHLVESQKTTGLHTYVLKVNNLTHLSCWLIFQTAQWLSQIDGIQP